MKLSRLLASLREKLCLHPQVLFYSAGFLIVSAWTLLRFFTTSSTFDLVTQQLVARSWIHGSLGHISLGTTNYIFKLLFLYIPADLLPGSPRLKLILVTLLINLATFFLLFKVLARILKEFGVKADRYLGLTILWLASISGFVFWSQYANSRNLEVVAGMYLIYLGLRYLRSPNRTLAIGTALFASILFFDDSLQIYMAALPLLIYAFLFANKKTWRRSGYLALIIAAGLAGSQIIFWLASRLLKIDFTSGGSFLVHQSLSSMIHSVATAAKTTLTIFSGGSSVSWWREALNLIFIGGAAAAFVWAGLRRLIPRRLAVFVAVYYLCNEAVYVISGQAAQPGTARYLILLVPITALAVSVSAKYFRGGYLIPAGLALVICLNAAAVGRALANNWDTGFPADAHLKSIASYVNQQQDNLAYASMDSALPVSYYKYAPRTHFVALACAEPKLQTARSVPSSSLPRSEAPVPLILDGTSIKNAPSVCTEQMIISQLGSPISIGKTNDGSSVLMYPAATLSSLK